MLSIFTIVLDGRPFIERHLPVFDALKIPWRWVIVEGAAQNTGCTAWCKPQDPRLSLDGTSEYLDTLKSHPNITVIQSPSWPGKLAMINAALAHMDFAAGVLMEIDADEIWTASQLEDIVTLFREHPYAGEMQFDCRYFVGADIVTVGENCYGNNPREWRRAWRWRRGATFSCHEPPVFDHKGATLVNEVTRQFGLVFDHYAYATEAQVRYKQDFYGYPGAVEGWRRLQANTDWPVKLRDFLPWVDDRAKATRI